MQIYNCVINKIGVMCGKDYFCNMKPIKRMIMINTPLAFIMNGGSWTSGLL